MDEVGEDMLIRVVRVQISPHVAIEDLVRSTDIIRNGFSQKIRFLGGAQTGVGLNHIDLVVCNIAMRFWDQSTRRQNDTETMVQIL